MNIHDRCYNMINASKSKPCHQSTLILVLFLILVFQRRFHFVLFVLKFLFQPSISRSFHGIKSLKFTIIVIFFCFILEYHHWHFHEIDEQHEGFRKQSIANGRIIVIVESLTDRRVFSWIVRAIDRSIKISMAESVYLVSWTGSETVR